MQMLTNILRKVCRTAVLFFRKLSRTTAPLFHRLSQITVRLLQRFSTKSVLLLRRFLRTCYRLGAPTCIFCGCVVLFVFTALILLITVPRAREAQAAANSSTTLPPVVTDAKSDIISIDPDADMEPSVVPDNPVEAVVTPDPVLTVTPEPTPVIQYEKGDEDPVIAEIQERLMDLGYMAADEPTEYFGPATQTAVELFQRQHELQKDGIVGNITYNLLMSSDAKPYVMFEGAEGKDIEAFQRSLYELGYLERNKITGYYGTDTIAAVQAFQKRNNLAQDGKAGELTIAAINSDSARPSAEREKEIEEEKKKAAEEAAKKTVAARIETFIDAAEDQLGKPYILGDSGPDSYDCSGLVYYCLRKASVYTRRLNAAGFSETSSWKKITSINSLKRGDLIFFKSDSSDRVSHVGIYLGGNTMIDASASEGKVVKRSLGSWSRRNFVCGRRPIS